MPELPDITVYLDALERRIVGRVLERILVADVFVLRTAIPPVSSLEGWRIEKLKRIGKRIALGFEGEGQRSRLHDLRAGADDRDDPGCHTADQREAAPVPCASPAEFLRSFFSPESARSQPRRASGGGDPPFP